MLHEVGGNHLKYLKRGWNGKEGRGNKDFKKGWQAGSRGECLKYCGRGGGRIPLQTIIYIIYIYISIYLSISIYLYLYLYLYLSVYYTVNNIAYCASRTSCAKVLELQCKCVSALFSRLSCFYLWLYIYIYIERERERDE